MSSTMSMNISARIESRLGLSMWLTLPVTVTQIEAALEKVYSYTGEYTVTGYVSTYPGMTADMLADAPLQMMNYLAARLGKLEEWNLEQFSALMQSDMRPQNIDELLDYLQNTNCYMFLPYVNTVERLGHYYLYESGHVNMPKRWKDAINLVVFGMNAAKQENGAFTSRGYIARFCAHKRKKPVTVETIPARYRLPEPVGSFMAGNTEGAEQ